MDKYFVAIEDLRPDLPFNFSVCLHYDAEAKEEFRYVTELMNTDTENFVGFKGKNATTSLMSCYYYLLGLMDYFKISKQI